MGYWNTTVVADTTFTLKDQMTMGESTIYYTSDRAYVWAEVSVIYKGEDNGYRTRSVAVVSGSSYSARVNNMGGNDYILELIETKYIPQPPSAPTFITIPSIAKGGENITVSWGSSSDATRYHLERSVNGGSWAEIYNGSNTSYTDTITKGWNTVVYRVRAYNSDGYSSYRTSATRTVINNTPPIISGQDQDLGDKNLGFLITYQVDDIDTSDNLVVTERLNGSVIRTINGVPRDQNLEIEITNEKLFSLPLNSTNTIEIKVDDGQGGIAYRRFTFRRTNTAPIISGNDEDLGQKLEPFSMDFSVSDVEGNSITVKTYLDNVLKEEYQAEDGVTNTFAISKEDWFKLPIGNHSIKIEAIDEHGATAIRNYAFERFDDKIQFTLKTPIETDIMATKILVTPTWTISTGAVAKIEACNNGFDEVPTWEDITSQVNISRHYNFTNDTKTADKWGINIRFIIEKGTATEQCAINGFGGAFE
ncbi:fibronectin type III domain-containing protein [Sporanaerobacter acetigenes]|uniref:fibronectin type III domain-containing protein n=1 Tax=Sporanaerobacter acetigenes TaxID=165813 RepID=UPI0010430C32|nr:fibronectin type III domain-containing protein [Sporanaerobacter acetigenes]